VILVGFENTSIRAAEAPQKTKNFAVPDHGDLVATLPEGWNATIQQAPGLPGTTIEFDGDKAGDVQVLVTAIPNGTRGHLKVDAGALKQLAQAQGTQLLATSKEPELRLDALKGVDSTGYFYNLTDKAPDPGSFERMTQGMIDVGDLLCTFTVLYHRPNQSQRTTALQMISTITEAQAAVPATNPSGLTIDGPSGAKWKLQLAANGFQTLQDDWSDDRKSRQFMATSNDSGLILSVFMEPALKPGSGAVVRDVYWGRAKQSPMKKEQVKLSALKANSAAMVEYITPDLDGVPVNDRNENVYIAHDGVWLDIHLSKTGFIAADQHLFDEIVNHIQFVAK
jgi:hypothetical protein